MRLQFPPSKWWGLQHEEPYAYGKAKEEVEDESPVSPRRAFSLCTVPAHQVFIDNAQFRYTRCGAVFPGNSTEVAHDSGQVLTFLGKSCPGFGAFTRKLADSLHVRHFTMPG